MAIMPMTDWRHSVEGLREAIDTHEDETVEAAHAIARVLGKAKGTGLDRDASEALDDLIEQLNYVTAPVYEDEVNDLLDEVYDWADDNRVWLA